MNAWAAVILAALLVQLALEATADVLNLRAAPPEPPAELREHWDAERYRRAREYARARTRFGLVAAACDLGVLLVFWFAGGFGRLDAALRALDLAPLATGLLFIGTLGLGRALLAVPFRWWSTFVIEAGFGLNRTTPWTFWTDLLKGLALAALLGAPLLAAVLWLFERAGAVAWLGCWGVSTAYLLLVQFVAPTWILPLFNRFTPLREGALRDAILAYTRAVGFPVEGLYVVDGSRRSTRANAFFTGFGRHKRIALFDTLVERHDPAEVVAVVAHEVGHYRRHHVLWGLLAGVLQAGATFFLLSLVVDRPGLFAAFFVRERSVYAGLVFFALLYAPLALVLSLGARALSRRYERQADAFAAETTGTGERLASALVRLSADALANPAPHPLYVLLHHSHPPVLARVRALRAQAAAIARAGRARL